MKDSTDGSNIILRRESAQRYGKCSAAKDGLDEALRASSHPRVSSVRVCCVGVRTKRWKRVPQKCNQRSEDVTESSAE